MWAEKLPPTFYNIYMDKDKINLYINNICLVTYEDAAYSYIDVVKNNMLKPKHIKTIGKIRRITDEFIDIGMVWFENTNKYQNGIILPINSIINIEQIFTK